MNVHVPGQDIETGYTWFLSCVVFFVIVFSLARILTTTPDIYSIIGGLVGFAVIGSILAYRLMVSR